MMRRLVYVMLATLLIAGSADIFAKRSSGFRSAPRKTSSFKPKTVPKPKPTVAPKKTRTEKKSTLKKKTDTKKQKAVSKNKMDRKQSKAMKTKNKAAAKKYGNKKNASKAYRNDMVKKNNYTSSTPPATRPTHVPQTVVITGHPAVSVGYYPFGGHYGYGYMDPITGTYMALTAHQMLMDDMAMQRAGYGHWSADGTPVVYRNTGAVFLWLIIILVVIVLIAVAFRGFS